MSVGRKVSFKVAARHLEDPRAPRRPAHVVIGDAGGGSPFGSTTYKRKRLCPFEDALVSVARLRPDRNAEALDVGWICHAAWEAYYRVIHEHQAALPVPSRKDAEAMQRYCFGASARAENAALDVVEAYAEEPHYRQTYHDCTRVISGYFDHYRGQDWWRVLAVEETLIYQDTTMPEAELWEGDAVGSRDHRIEFRPFAYSARLDAVVQDLAPGRGGVYNVEHKTAKFINEDLVHGYQQDMQILGQHWLLDRCVDPASLPAPIMGVIVNIATKQKTPSFERVEVSPSPYHLQAFEDSTRRWDVVNALFRWAGYPKALGSCAGALRGYSRCAYYDLCHGYPERTIADFVREAPPVGYHREEQG